MMMMMMMIMIAVVIILGPKSNCDFSNISLRYLDVSLRPLHPDAVRNSFQ